MKLRIPTKMTGWIGRIEFVDGVSVNPVTVQEANLYRVSQAGVEILEDDGETVDEALNSLPELHPREHYLEWNMPVPSPYLPLFMGGYPSEEVQAQEQEIIQKVEQEVKAKDGFTRADLEEIADKQGIAGLRRVAERYNVKSTSIPKLIDLIVEAQAPAEQEPKVDQAPQAEEASAQVTEHTDSQV